ncbi:MAG TPA: hypothetical protein VE243_11340 [Candidatus Acidoferrum sp.]|nr:hypothetical protein [Candidatus Acidoferrum sp.]
MQYLVGIRVADTAEDVRVGERPLERMIRRAKRRAECVEARVERLDTAGAERPQTGFSFNHAQSCAALRARFGEPEPAVVELEREEDIAAAELWRRGLPVQTASDHKMQHEPQVVIDADRDLLAYSAYLVDGLTQGCADRGRGRAQQERRLDQGFDKFVTDDALSNRFNVHGDIG